MTGAFTVVVEGAVISGETTGSGTPLVLVHGMAGDRYEWNGLIAALPTTFATLRYDLRGFGQSAAQDVEFSHADDLLALFDALGIERAPLLGLSMGGGIALNFALSHPERVARLILLSPSLIGWEASGEWKALWRGVTTAARGANIALARQRWFDHPMFAALRRDPASAAELRRVLGTYHGRQWIRDWQRDELPDIDRLHRLAVPTLLLTGECDHPDLRLIADLIEAAAPGVRRIDHADAGHMLHIERKTEVASAIARFLGA
ncbi:MAG: alpha/beta fold hydrolase [Novosphingobium sp.]